MNFKKLAFWTTLFTTAATPLATAQNPVILQGNYISNVFGQSNFILNPNAQTNVANVTVSSATVTRSTTTPLVATSEFNITTSTATGYADWTTRTFDAGMKNQNCEARFTYRGFSVGSTTVQIRQGSNTVAQLTLTASTDPRIASINFPCGDLSSATTLRVQQATASLTGTNEIGGIYVGLATNQANVAQAEFVGGYDTLASGTNPTTTSATFASLSGGTATATLLGKATSYDAASGAVTFASLPAGTYYVTSPMVFASSSGTECRYRLYEDTAATFFGNIYTTNTSYVNVIGQITLTTTASRVFRVQAIRTAGTGSCTMEMRADVAKSQFQVYRFPTSSELVVTPERQNTWGGVQYTASINNELFGGSAQSTASWTAFNNASYNAPSALKGKAAVTTTGSGNDLGISIPNMPTGSYNVDVAGLLNAYISSTVTGYKVTCNFRLRETTTNTVISNFVSMDQIFGANTNYETQTLEPNFFTGVFINTSVGTRNFIVEAQKSGDTNDSSTNIGKCRHYNQNSGQFNTTTSITISPLDQPSNSALYVQGPVLGAQTGAAVSAGYVGEVIEATRTSDVVLSASANTPNDITGLSVSLTPGVWEVESFSGIYIQGAAGTGQSGRLARLQITDNSNNVQREVVCGFTNSVVANGWHHCIAKVRLTVTSGTTTYKSRADTIENSGATTNPTAITAIATSNRPAVLRAVRIN